MRYTYALFLLLGLTCPVVSHAQDATGQQTEAPLGAVGVVAGKVVDGSTGKGISGVSVSISGTGLYTTSGIDGQYRIADVPAGTLTMTFYKGGYEYSAVKDVDIQTGMLAKVDMAMNPRAYEEDEFDVNGDIVMLDAITVVASQLQDSQVGLQQLRSKSLNVSDAIGADDFSKQGLGDAAEAMSRVTGASVMDGKYVLIRGLGDRYANTQLNGVAMPSADPDKRAVQMDQFPTDLLESIQTAKSFTPDMAGDFAGGSVNIRTKNFPDQFFASVSMSVGYNSNVTGKDILSSREGVSSDGIDAGNRWAPETPEGLVLAQTAYTKARTRTDPTLEPAHILSDFSNQFQHSMFPKTITAHPNMGFSASVGSQNNLGGDRRIGYTLSFTYDRDVSGFDDGFLSSYKSLEAPKFIYDTNPDDYPFYDRLEGKTLPWGETHWGYTKSTQSVTWGAFAKIAFQSNANNEISLDLYHNQYAEDETRRGVGVEPENYPTMIYENYSMLYTERGMSSVQLHGKHSLVWLHDVKVEWGTSWNRSTQKQPDFRVLQTLYDVDSEEYSTNTAFQPSRFFRDLDEISKDGNLDISVPLRLFNDMESTIKFGALYSRTNRTYSEDQYTAYIGRGSTAITSWDQERNAFADGTIGVLGTTDNGSGGWLVDFGWTVYPTNTYVSNYEGKQEVGGTYAMADLVYSEHWRVVAGARAEHTGLRVTTFKSLDGSIADQASILQTDILPAASLIYTIKEGMNLRFAYGATIARPTFKELTSARIYDPFRREYYQGNAGLVMTSIDNFDLRWEWFMDKGEMVAVSMFYKLMDNPIEVMFKDVDASGKSTGMEIISPINRDEAVVSGIEGEFRFNLAHVASWLEDFTLGGNASLIDSKVSGGMFNDLPLPDATLVGQSRYVINANLTYQNFGWGSAFTLVANKVGERMVGFTTPGDSLPDIFEKPPVTLNLIISQKIWREMRVKVGFSNILDSNYERTYGKGSGILSERYHNGRTVSLSLSYNF
ncbi:MAG: TonB-dependent receptor [Opitutales bacterium]